MQYNEQERRYHENLFAKQSERVGYLNPMRICKKEHTFEVGGGNNELFDKTAEEIVELKKEMKKDLEAKYCVYLGHAMLQLKDRACIVDPYKFKYV